MKNSFTCRQEAEAIEQFGDDLAALDRRLDQFCKDASRTSTDLINAIEHQDRLSAIAENLRALGDRLCRECDAAEEAQDRRRDNPLERDFRRLGQ